MNLKLMDHVLLLMLERHNTTGGFQKTSQYYRQQLITDLSREYRHIRR